MKDNLLSVAGAVVGGILGYLGFFWLANQGFYALALPGALLGLGAGVVKNRSPFVAIACGIVALALGVFAEYRLAPFIADESLKYFLTHVHQLKSITLLMILIGGAVGFYVPFSHRHT